MAEGDPGASQHFIAIRTTTEQRASELIEKSRIGRLTEQ
jgi:hypothetical protein